MSVTHFDTYIEKCLLKSESKIKSLCSPLQDCLDIPIFGYYYLDEAGHYCNIANDLTVLEGYYEGCLYLNDPYLRNPRFFRTGYSLVQMTSNKKQQKEIQQEHGINLCFQLLYKHDDYIEGFIFAQRHINHVNGMHFFDKAYLLEKFARFFKLEAKSIINKIIENGYNMKTALANKFDMPISSLCLLSTERNNQFLERIDPLSERENQCVDLYKEGCSAQATAARLGISQRTVEHHLDNAKLKFGFSSKTQFLKL